MSPLSTILKNRRIKLVGHTIRADDNDPMRHITINNGTPLAAPKRRVGRPRIPWAKTAMCEAYNLATGWELDVEDVEQIYELENHAIVRTF